MRTISTLLLLFLSLLTMSGQERVDSVTTAGKEQPLQIEPLGSPVGVGFDETLPMTPDARTGKLDSTGLEDRLKRSIPPRFSLQTPPALPYYTNPSPMFRGDYSTGGTLWSNAYGAVIGSGSQESLPGIGRMNSASLGYQHRFSDKLTLYAGLDATKLNWTHMTGQMFSASGRLNYQLSDKLSVSAFGSYALGKSYGLNTHSYGATVNWQVSDAFGMQVGAQRRYNMYTGRWELIPVAIPYVKVGEAAIGLDVGGILYHILKESVHRKREHQRFGPTIAPPRPEFPIMGR